MNFDKTPFSSLKANGVNAADNDNMVLAPQRVSEAPGFIPKNGLSTTRDALQPLPTPKPKEVIHQVPYTSDVMNQGLSADTHSGLFNPGSPNGGSDGGSSSVFASAMKSSVRSLMPETLESQLNLFKDEPKHVIDTSMVTRAEKPEEQLHVATPVVATYDVVETLLSPPTDTAINGVSTDEENERRNSISMHH